MKILFLLVISLCTKHTVKQKNKHRNSQKHKSKGSIITPEGAEEKIDQVDLYYRDYCMVLKQGEEAEMTCDMPKCPNGIISSIQSAMAGLVLGSCPYYHSAFLCFQDVHTVIAETPDLIGSQKGKVKNQTPYPPQFNNALAANGQLCMFAPIQTLNIVYECQCSQTILPLQYDQPPDLLNLFDDNKSEYRKMWIQQFPTPLLDIPLQVDLSKGL